MSQYLSRKFVLVLVAIVSLSVMGFMGKISAQDYLLQLPIILGIYSASNVISKFATPSVTVIDSKELEE